MPFTIHQAEAISARAEYLADYWLNSGINGAFSRSLPHLEIRWATIAMQDCLAGHEGFETAGDDLWNALDGHYADYRDMLPKVAA